MVLCPELGYAQRSVVVEMSVCGVVQVGGGTVCWARVFGGERGSEQIIGRVSGLDSSGPVVLSLLCSEAEVMRCKPVEGRRMGRLVFQRLGPRTACHVEVAGRGVPVRAIAPAATESSKTRRWSNTANVRRVGRDQAGSESRPMCEMGDGWMRKRSGKWALGSKCRAFTGQEAVARGYRDAQGWLLGWQMDERGPQGGTAGWDGTSGPACVSERMPGTDPSTRYRPALTSLPNDDTDPGSSQPCVCA